MSKPHGTVAVTLPKSSLPIQDLTYGGSSLSVFPPHRRLYFQGINTIFPVSSCISRLNLSASEFPSLKCSSQISCTLLKSLASLPSLPSGPGWRKPLDLAVSRSTHNTHIIYTYKRPRSHANRYPCSSARGQRVQFNGPHLIFFFAH